LSTPPENAPDLESASNAVHILLNHYVDELPAAFKRVHKPEEHIVEIGLLSRSMPLVEAALMLAERGCGREAMMLNRALFELLIDANWAQAHPDLAAERYLAHARYTQHLQRQVFQRYPETGFRGPAESLPAEEIKASRKLFGKHAGRSWTGVSTSERVRALEQKVDPSEQRSSRFLHEVLNDAANAELHPSSWSLARALRRVRLPGGGYKFQFRSGPEPELAPAALAHTWWMFARTLDLMHELAGLPDETLQEAVDAGRSLLGAEAEPASSETPGTA
jgi:hypothetical protein